MEARLLQFGMGLPSSVVRRTVCAVSPGILKQQINRKFHLSIFTIETKVSDLNQSSTKTLLIVGSQQLSPK